MHTEDTQLIDGFGRKIDYIRLSVTDRCDFRCVYCMSEEMQFLPRARILSLEELATLSRLFVSMGVRRIRLTGGEPLVRNGIVDLVRHIAALPDLDEVTLTTNGSQLGRLARPLKDAGLARLNISLDSLQPARFAALTRRDKLTDVLTGIDAAIAAGFERIKLNAVIMKGRNHDEVLDLLNYADRRGLDISYIEEMPLGAISEHNRDEVYCSSDEVRSLIGQQVSLIPSTEVTGGPSRYYRMPGSRTRVGFISPHSHNFCASCNRVRITAEGQLLLCLGRENAVDLRSALRRYPGEDERLKQIIRTALQHKPQQHRFGEADAPQVLRFMNMTGG